MAFFSKIPYCCIPDIGTVVRHFGLDLQRRSPAMSLAGWYCCKLLAFSALATIPLFVVMGYFAGMPWLVPALAFIGISVLDLLIGSGRTLQI
jgi:hypothetical protein